MRALGEEFPHYAVFAPSDHDLLIVAGATRRCRCRPQAEVFEQPGLAKELWTVHVLSVGRPRRALPRQPRHARAAVRELRHAGELRLLPGARPQRRAPPLHGEERRPTWSALLNAGVPVLEMLEPGAQPPRGQSAVHGRLRLRAHRERAPRAGYARDFLLAAALARARGRCPTQLQKDLELVKLRLHRMPRPARARRLAAQPAARRAGR